MGGKVIDAEKLAKSLEALINSISFKAAHAACYPLREENDTFLRHFCNGKVTAYGNVLEDIGDFASRLVTETLPGAQVEEVSDGL